MLSIFKAAINNAAAFVLVFSFVYFSVAFILTFIKSIRDSEATSQAPSVPGTEAFEAYPTPPEVEESPIEFSSSEPEVAAAAQPETETLKPSPKPPQAIKIQADEVKAAELLHEVNQIDESNQNKTVTGKRMVTLAGKDIRIYRYHQHDVVLVKDLPFTVPPKTKRYSLRKRPAIHLEKAQALAEAHVSTQSSDDA